MPILLAGLYALLTRLVSLKCLPALQRHVLSLWFSHLTEGLFCHHLTFLLTESRWQGGRAESYILRVAREVTYVVLLVQRGFGGVCVRGSYNK